MEEDDGHLENGLPAAKDSDRQQRLRLCVLNEILNTERDYVRTLLFLQSVSVTLPFTFRISHRAKLQSEIYHFGHDTRLVHCFGQMVTYYEVTGCVFIFGTYSAH